MEPRDLQVERGLDADDDAPPFRGDGSSVIRSPGRVCATKRCTGCAGRTTVRAVVTDPASIARLLGAFRRSRDPPVAA